MSSYASPCTQTNEVCVDHSTRVIEGFSHTRCWSYERTYSCGSEDYTDHCAAINQTPSCYQLSSVCESSGADGVCDSYKNTYVCSDVQTTSDDLVHIGSEHTITTNELDEAECEAPANNPHCSVTEKTCIEGEETRNINGLDVHKACWKWDYKYSCQSDVQYSNCEQLEENCTYKSKSCFSQNEQGECMASERSYQCEEETGDTTATSMVCQGQTYCINGECETTEYEPDTGMSEGLAYMNLLKEAGDEFDADTLKVFSGVSHGCDKSIGGFNNCCKDDGWGQDVSLASCSAEEKDLDVKASAGQCHYIGTYCADETFFGVCLKKRKTYCCFNSKLGRVIHEQGRGSIEMSWGSAQAPRCEGMTIEQLESVDFTQVDMSELYPDIEGNVTIPNDASIVEDLSDKIGDYYEQ